jgi:integrase/recombinase XerD
MPGEAAIPDTLTAPEVDALFALAGFGPSKTARRNKALLMVMHDAALRSAEVVALKPGDVDVAAGNVRVRDGKGGKARQIRDCLHADTKQALAAWLTLREGLGWDGRSAYLFGSFHEKHDSGEVTYKGGGELDTSYLRRLLPRLARRAKLKATRPHLLRHTRAREWSDLGRPPADIQHDLGHKSLQTTSIYLARFASAGAGAGERGRGA